MELLPLVEYRGSVLPQLRRMRFTFGLRNRLRMWRFRVLFLSTPTLSLMWYTTYYLLVDLVLIILLIFTVDLPLLDQIRFQINNFPAIRKLTNPQIMSVIIS
jgi:hypothetical protein